MLAQATVLAGDLFRITDQNITATYANQNTPQNQTISEGIAQVLKNHIALLDTGLTFAQYAFKMEALNAWVAPFRMAAVAQGIYQLQSNPQADTKSITREIILNLLNIGHVAMKRFSQNAASTRAQNVFAGAALACIVGDAVLRMHALYANRTTLADRVKGYYAQGFSHMIDQTGKLLYAGGDYVLRTALAAVFILGAHLRAQTLLSNATSLSYLTIYEFIGWTGLTGTLSLFMSEAVHKIFDNMGLQATPKRKFVELSLSALGSASLMAAVAVGLGRVASFSAIVKPIFAPVAITAMAGTLAYLFKTATSQCADAWNIQPGFLRSLEEWTFTVVGSLALTAIAAAGFGISKSAPESISIMFRTMSVALSTFFIWFSIAAAARTVLLGTPSWDEIGDWAKYV